MDVLSDAIGVMRTGRASSSRLQVAPPWCYRFASYDGAGFHVLLSGTGWLVPAQGQPISLGVGDVVLVPHGSAHILSGSPSAEGAVPFEAAAAPQKGPTDFLCGKYRLDRSRTHPLLAGLPEIVHLPASIAQYPELHVAIGLLGSEVRHGRPGRDAALSGLLDLLLLYMVRACLNEDSGAGWPRALRDPQIAAALEALHSDPAKPWRIEDLAARVNLSRATLARRFTTLIGQPPMTYLAWWRMTTAARLLRDTELPLPKIAHQVGYGTPFAFSHAFKRHFGMTPGRYRSPRVEQ